MAKKRKFFKRLVIVPIATMSLFSAASGHTDQAKPLKAFQSRTPQEGYTVNFNNVSALELLKFISKISNTNFIYEPQDLQFNVTFTSDEPTSLENIMTAFSQVLRIHGLLMIEEGNNLVIHKNSGVKQIADIVTDAQGLKADEKGYLITRVFNIRNANPTNIETILAPLLSTSAVITTVPDTRQMILMDLSSNVDKVAELVSLLDMPSSNLQMKSYKLKNGNAEAVSLILNQLIMPLSEGNPVILVPQTDTNTLFIVSTPYLLQKSIEILLQLDQVVKVDEKNLTLENILIYKLQSKSFGNIQKSLNEILQNANKQGYQVGGLAQAIKGVQFIPSTNSILFIGDKASLDKLKSFLAVMDETTQKKSQMENNKFFIYDPQNKSADEIFKYLKEIEKHLISSHLGDPNLITTLESMKMIGSTNSIIFTGDPESINEITNLIKTLDFSDFSSINEFLIYTPIHLSPQNLMDSLKQVSKKLSASGLEDPALLKAIETAQYIPSSYSIVFTGSQETITKIKKVMDDLDSLNKKGQLDENMLIYKLKFASRKSIDQALETFAESLPIESSIHDTIEGRSYLPQSNSFVFRGNKDAIEKIQQVLDLTDTASSTKDQVLMYKIQSTDESAVLENLKTYVAEISPQDRLYESLKNYRYLANSNMIIFKGTSEELKDIEQIMKGLDNPLNQVKMQVLNYKVQSPNFKGVLENLKKVQDKTAKSDPLYNVLKNAQVIESSRLIIFKGSEASINDLKDLLAQVDLPESISAQDLPTQVVYNLKTSSGQAILNNLKNLEAKLKKDPTLTDSKLIETIKNVEWIKETNSLVITGPKKEVDQTLTFIGQFDSADQEKMAADQVLNYKIQSLDVNKFYQSYKAYVDTLKPSDPFYRVFKNAQFVQGSSLIIFRGSASELQHAQDLMAKIDVITTTPLDMTPTQTIYTIKNSSGKDILANLAVIEAKIKKEDPSNDSLIKTIKNVSWIQDSNSLLVSGPKKDVDQVIAFINQFDVVSTFTKDGVNTDFMIYRPTNISAKDLKRALEKAANDLEQSNLSDPTLIQSLKAAKLSDNGQSIVITGNDITLKKAKDIIATYDVALTPTIAANFYSYKPENVSAKELKSQLVKIVEGISGDPDIHDPTLVKVVINAQVMDSTNTILFTGSEENLSKIKLLIQSVDTLSPKEMADKENSNFFIYRPTKLPAAQIKKNLDGIISEFEKTGLTDSTLIKSLRSSRLVEDNRSIVFTGNSETLKKVQSLLETVDISPTTQDPANTHFYLYKTISLPPTQVHDQLMNIASDLEKSGLSDPRLIKTIRQSKVVEQSGSIAFTGDEPTLSKIKDLLSSVDVQRKDEGGIQHIGQTTFMIYKIQQANPSQLMESLRAIAKDLSKSKGGDQELIKAIDNMRYVDETNSIVFTGHATTLNKISQILEKFDTPSTRKSEPTRINAEEYQLYQPRNLSGDELIHLMKDFETSLRSTGVKDHQLIDCIQNLKWMPKTATIIVSGDKQSITKVIALLEKFDVPGKSDKKAEPAIETIEDTSFLIYKVQYHKGSAILDAVQGIGNDLKNNQAASTQALVSAIRSLQEVRVTNSLVATGDPKSLTKLKELIQNIDIPLRQIFIEVLVIETDLNNNFSLGLRWAAQGNIKNRLAFSGANISPNDPINNIPLANLVSKVNATTPPNPGDLPVVTGGSLGVIGDLIFHKGKSYLALGDFINALQLDTDSTIILNQKIITQDNRDSQLFVGQNIPYTGSLVSNQSQTTTTSANIEYMDVGIKLDITPKVGDDDVITMDIQQSITEETNPAAGGTTQAGNNVFGIQTRKTTLNTSVHVPNDHFVVLTGQIRNTTVRQKSAIPCLGGLPLIGAAFTDNSISKNNSSIVMFIKPHIINTYEEYKKITERQEDVYRENGVDEDFDNGLELVKTPEDG